MCPLCIGAAWLIAGGVSSAGGVATVAWRSVSKRRRRPAVKKGECIADKRATSRTTEASAVADLSK